MGKYYDYIEVENLKDMLNKTYEMYKGTAFKIRNKEKEGEYILYSHKEIRDMVNHLGTKLIDMGFKDKRVAVIGENRFEWEVSYLSVVCGTGTVVPLDKALPENELISLIERSEVEAIFASAKYIESLVNIVKSKKTNLKCVISFDIKENTKDVLSFYELVEEGKALVEKGDRKFIDATIDNEAMQIMLFTSGTTSKSKVVALCHRNLVSNLMSIAQMLELREGDTVLSILPVHHVFECTVGFLFALYRGAETVFSDGVRHVVDNLKEYEVDFAACVPGIYETIYRIIRKHIDKQGKLEEIMKLEEEYKDASMEVKKEVFKDIHALVGGNIKQFISGAAKLDPKIEQKFRDLGFNLIQGYGLTETSPVVALGSNFYYKCGTIGKTVPNVEAKLIDCNQEGVGELCVKGPSVMMGYYQNEEANKEVFEDGWFKTGDLATIDENGYIEICGRKKSVIVLKNGKNIFPEEMENLINKIDGVKESFVYGKEQSEDKDDIKIYSLIVVDKEHFKEENGTDDLEEIRTILKAKIKEINQMMPGYKSIRKVLVTEKPLIKTTTNKIKRQDNLNEVNKLEN